TAQSSQEPRPPKLQAWFSGARRGLADAVFTCELEGNLIGFTACPPRRCLCPTGYGEFVACKCGEAPASGSILRVVKGKCDAEVFCLLGTSQDDLLLRLSDICPNVGDPASVSASHLPGQVINHILRTEVTVT